MILYSDIFFSFVLFECHVSNYNTFTTLKYETILIKTYSDERLFCNREVNSAWTAILYLSQDLLVNLQTLEILQ